MSLRQKYFDLRCTVNRFLSSIRGDRGTAAPHRALQLEGLEERVLYSAVPAAAVIPEIPEAVHVAPVDPSLEAAADSPLDVPAIDPQSPSGTLETQSAATLGSDADVRTELVFVDTAAADYQQLLDDLLASDDVQHEFDVHLLDSSHDGIQQIGSVLDRHRDVDAVHIISHGTQGEVKLGDTWLSIDTVGGYTGELAHWGWSLAADADILFYGCELAASDAGQDLVEVLGSLTGADVAASDDHTGHARYGGDWNLEYISGTIETQVAFSSELQQTWQGKLALITVDTTADVVDGGDGLTSLREAILQVNAGAGGDTIVLGAGTYTLSIAGGGEDSAGTGDLDILKDVTITGAGATTTTIDGGAIDRVFQIFSPAVVDMSGLTIQNGGNVAQGGGIQVLAGGDLSLSNAIVSGNVTAINAGAGIDNSGTLTLSDVHITGNTGGTNGGGLNNNAAATLERVTIDNNNANRGAGIYNAGPSPTLSLTNVTLSNNTAATDGGGIFTTKLIPTIVNSTIAYNTASSGAGGIHVQGAAGDADLLNTILASNTGGNANGVLTSSGFNIDSDGTASLSQPSDVVADPVLDATLQNNGGFAPTHALTASSTDAIDGGTTSGAPTLDQRGFGRDATPDIGAYEFGAAPTNQPPTITSSASTSVAENQTAVLTVTATDPDLPADTITYSLTGGADQARFSINASTGVLTFNTAPDFEAPTDADTNNVYEVQVTANDGNGGTDVQAISVTVTDANDPPIADATGGAPYVINEGDSVTLNGSLSSDPESQPLTYEWDLNNDLIYGDVTGVTPVVSSATLQSFGINDDGAPYTIGLRVTDDTAQSDTTTTTLTVNNTAPTLATTGAATVGDGGLYTLNLSSSDPGTDTITGWTINWGDGTIDTIVGNPSSVTHTYNGAGFTYNILASATDEDGTFLQNELLVAGRLSDNVHRYAPTTGNFLQVFGSADGLNQPGEAVIGPDGNLYVSSALTDNVLRFNATSGAFIDEFVAAGVGGLDGPQGMTFGPDGKLYVTSSATNEVLRFDAATGAFVDVFVSAGSGGLLDPTEVAFGPDGNLYVDSSNTDQILRYNGSTGAFIDAFVDGGGADQPQHFTFGPDGNLYVAIRNADRVERYNGATGAFIDNFVPTGSGGLDGPRGVTFGPDGNLYVSSGQSSDEILRYDGNTGAFIDVYVTAGSGGLDGPQPMTFVPGQQVAVTTNTPPTITSSSTPSVVENQTLVLTVTTTDPDVPADTITYSLTGGVDQARFNINATTGVLTFSTAPDFEAPTDADTNNVYEVQVTANDGNGGTDVQSISVTVTDVNDAPLITSSSTPSVVENQTSVLTVTTTDPDVPADTITYSLTGGVDQARFNINATTGVLTFSTAPDFEAPTDADTNNVYEVQVTANDGNGGTDVQSISVTVTDVNDAPLITSSSTPSMVENQTSVLTVTTTDQDVPADTITYSLTGGADQSRFTINATTGVLTFNTAPDFETPTDADTNNVYEVQVTANDGNGGTDVQSISVTVTDVNDAPLITSSSTPSMVEKSDERVDGHHDRPGCSRRHDYLFADRRSRPVAFHDQRHDGRADVQHGSRLRNTH